MREAAITPVNSRWNIPVIAVIDLYCDLLSVRAHERSFNLRFTTGRLVLCWFTVLNTPPQALRICVCWMCVCACFCLCEIESGSKLPLQQTIDQKSYISSGDSHLLNCCIDFILCNGLINKKLILKFYFRH